MKTRTWHDLVAPALLVGGPVLFFAAWGVSPFLEARGPAFVAAAFGLRPDPRQELADAYERATREIEASIVASIDSGSR